jgi:hypothetical protein
MSFKPAHKDTDNPPGQIVNPVRTYLETINHPDFREASIVVQHARERLKKMGMTQEEAFGWIKAWASGAGDGSE